MSAQRSRKAVKLEKWKPLVIVAGGNLAEIRPLLTLPRNSESSKMGIARSGDSGKYFSGNTRKVVKLEKWESLVIVVGGNLAEIRPLLTIGQKYRKFKMGIIRSGDSGKYFPKSDDYGKHFSK